MARPKAKREIATKNIRIYPTTLKQLQFLSNGNGKTIARIVSEEVEFGVDRYLTYKQ